MPRGEKGPGRGGMPFNTPRGDSGEGAGGFIPPGWVTRQVT